MKELTTKNNYKYLCYFRDFAFYYDKKNNKLKIKKLTNLANNTYKTVKIFRCAKWVMIRLEWLKKNSINSRENALMDILHHHSIISCLPNYNNLIDVNIEIL